MEKKLQLCVLMLHIHVSLAAWQHITVMRGTTINLDCPIKHKSSDHPVEWKNSDVLKDTRYTFRKLSESMYSISISNARFSDGGTYTCSHYLTHVDEKTVKVTVLDRPRVEIMPSNDWTVVKCTAAANYPPPEISWRFKNGSEFRHDAVQKIKEDKKYVTIDLLHIKAEEKDYITCVVRHPALHSQPLMDFARIKPKNNRRNRPKTPVATPAPATPGLQTTAQVSTIKQNAVTLQFSTTIPQFSTGIKSDSKPTIKLPEASTRPKTLFTTEKLPSDEFSTTKQEALTTDVLQFSTDAEAVTEFPVNTSQSHRNDTSTVDSTTQRSGILNTTRNWFTSTFLPANVSFNETTKNRTESGNDVERRKGNQGNIALLIFLITCLLLGLLVVVIFIGIKLRKAHIIWKRENDDTDTSESSSKSKSSQEDKNTQRRRGFFNTGLTQYVIQEPTVVTSVTNPAAMTSPENVVNEQNSPTRVPPQATPKPKIKETEL